jgi:RNA polymerase sigma factor for flagellar operon FliA
MTATPSPQTLIEECQGLVRSLASRIHRKLPPYIDLEDVIAYGQVGLAEAARDFDATRGTQFSTFAYYRIRGAIYDGLAKMSWFSRAEYHRRRYDQMAGEVLRQEAEEGEQAAPRDIEDDMGWFRDLGQSLAVVYLASHTELKDHSNTQWLVDASPPPPTAAILHEVSQKLHELIRALPEDAGKLIRATYFEGLDLQKAGQRLGISKSWASRLHAKTLRRLARDLQLSGET